MEQGPTVTAQVVAPPPPPPGAAALGAHSARHSIETLLVVLAVIAIAAIFAGVFARMCGGRHGDRDIEGWVESKCRSCLDGGVPSQPPPPPPPQARESKK